MVAMAVYDIVKRTSMLASRPATRILIFYNTNRGYTLGRWTTVRNRPGAIPHSMIPTPIPIPAHLFDSDSDSDSSHLGYDSDSDSDSNTIFMNDSDSDSDSIPTPALPIF